MLLPLMAVAMLQGVPVCDGLTMTDIFVRTHAPSSVSARERAADAVSASVGLEERRTAADVSRAYVRLKIGEPCSDLALAESERMLRAQPFVASASVRAISDGSGGVRIRVDVVDEVPWVGGARFKGARPRGVDFGTRNLRGRGITLIAGIENREAYRDGGRITIGQYGAFGRPAYASLTLHKRPLGGLLQARLSEPFYTAGQKSAMLADYTQEVEYGVLVRPGDVDAAARVRRTAYSAGWIRRIGVDRRSGALGLGGLLLMGTDVRTSPNIGIVSDTGLYPSFDTTLDGRFPDYAVGRIAATGGIRALRFRRVARFETLLADQDVGEGAEVQLLVGPSFGAAGLGQDLLMAGDLYYGVGGPRSFAAMHLRAEGRHYSGPTEYRGAVASAQLSWYLVATETRTRTFTASVAAVDRLVFPVQLSLRDPVGGVIGLVNSREAGGRRASVRVEQRRLMGWFRPRAAVAIGAFADAGQVWAGDVVYGVDSPVRGSVGLSFFTSIPSTAKRVYRLDIGVPVNPDGVGFQWGLRLSSGDRTGAFWAEPRDVARARAGTGPPALTRW